ncbi:non-ribosomal peptide synthetase, partial [Gordonia sp. GAMMA]
MTDVDSTASNISLTWGSRPSTLHLIAFSAGVAPSETAYEAVSGPVTFGELYARVSATAQIFIAQGLDTEAAVGAGVTQTEAAAGRAPAEIADATRRAIALIRERALELIGSTDLGSLPGLVRAAVARHADRPAVSDASGAVLSYRELDERSDALAGALRATGAGPGRLVGVALPRRAELIVALLAVLKTGAAYLPLDRSQPVARAQSIIDDAAPLLVLADAELAAAWGVVDVRFAAPEELAAGTPQGAGEALDERLPAYLIYTSGSTGRPKGVVVSHHEVVALMKAAAEEFSFGPDDVWTLFHSYAFDFSVWEIWGPLVTGGRVVVVDQDTTRDPDAFVELLESERVTVLSQTPSAFYQLITAQRQKQASFALRYIVFGGEALSFEQVRRWFDDNPADGAQLVNMYGITETTVHVSYRALDRDAVSAGDASFIGRPLSSLDIHILDSRLRPVPDGVIGEMYVTGKQLAQGYLRRAGLSATRFVANPFAPNGSGDRMYRTGDLARRVGDDIEYLGRGDAQVQLRGFRIEYGEIEAALVGVDGIAAGAANVVDLPDRGEILAAYVVPEPGVELDEQLVRRRVATTVPEYMVPDVVMAVERLPLTQNGKLDRGALPRPVLASTTEFVAPEDDTEAALRDIFAEVLGLEDISVVESVFDVGGNSLLAARIVGRAAETLGVDLTVRDLFDAPTVRDLALAAASKRPGLPPIEPVADRPDRIPLSLAQQRMWFINRFDPASPAYNIPMVLRLSGDVDADALRAALLDVMTRHEVLRTTYPEADGDAYQLVHEPSATAAMLDWREVPEAALPQVMLGGFDLVAELPVRVGFSRISDTEAVLGMVVHHISCDGESLAPLVTDLITAYTARVAGRAPEFEPLPVHMADVALWQRRVFGAATDDSSLIGAQLQYWARQLDGAPDVLELPTDRPRPAVASQRGARVEFSVPQEVSERVARLARDRGLTPFMVAHAALAVLLSRLSATEDIAVGTPIAGRGQSILDPMVGMFVNTLVLRTGVDSSAGFDQLLDDVRRTDLEAFANADIPFEAVVERVNPLRTEAYAPLAQVWLAFDQSAIADLASQTLTIGGGTIGEAGGLAVTPAEPDELSARVDLTVGIADNGDNWQGSVLYATDLYDAESVRLFADRFVRLLDALTADPGAPVGDAELMTSAEHEAIERWVGAADTDAGPGQVVTVADALADSFARNASRPAVRAGGRTYDHAEYGALVHAFARRLLEQGVGPDVAVAVAVPRSVEMLVAIHGIVLAGGTYVPIDPEAPAEVVRRQLALSGASTVVVAGARPSWAEAASTVPETFVTVDLDALATAASAPLTPADRPVALRAGHPVYTLFTSGSTGQPKGVTVTHRGLHDMLSWFGAYTGDPADERVLVKTPYTFDASVWELFWPFVAGATAVVATPDGHRDPAHLARVIADERVTSVQFVPSLLAVFLDESFDPATGLSSVRQIFTGGESLTPAVTQQTLAAAPHAVVVNQYGPTEMTVDATIRPLVEPAEVVTIGRPAPGVTARVLDNRLRPVPPGVPGELYLGGAQMARGYAGAPALTAQAFVADLAGPAGSRLYRTGDLARWRADGELEYLGRADFQVKIHGQRIELGETEAVLSAAPGVVAAAAAVTTTSAGDALVAYLTGHPGDTVDVDTVRAFAAERLLTHLRPTLWVVLDEMPRNASGKVDRRALPAPTVSESEIVEPTTPAEQALAAVVAEVLGVERVSVVDSFFDLGGNSLAAMRVAARAGAALGVEVSVRDLFDAPSVRELAQRVADRVPGLPPVTAVRPRPDEIPLSYAQQRIWFINQFDTSSAAYNIPIALRLRGKLDLAALRAAMVDVVERQEVLRTVFPSIDGAPRQVIGDATGVDAELDWAVVDEESDLFAAAGAGFDVAVQRPIRIRVHRVDDLEHIVLIVIHHIAGDGESMRPLVTDVVTAYVARSQGRSPDFAELEVQFADVALWQRRELGSIDDPDSRVSAQVDYWRTALAGLPEVLELPADRPRPKVASMAGAEVGFEIDSATADLVRNLATERGVTEFMVIHAALAVLLSRLSATDDIAIGTPIAGRGDAALDPLVGMFVNTLVLRTVVDPAQRFTDLLDAVRVTDLDAFAHADAPFEAVVDALAPSRSEAFAPLTQILLTVDPTPADPSTLVADIDELAVEVVETEENSAKVDLTVGLRGGRAGSWIGRVNYATDLFDEATVARMMDRFARLLHELVTDATVPVGDADLFDTDERELLTPVGRQPATPAVPLAELFAAAVRRGGADRTAVVDPERSLTYAELDAASNRLARHLLDRGIGRGTLVALLIPRSAELMVAIWAVAKTGAGYVPIDPDYPADRVSHMITDSGARLGLTLGDVAGPGIPGSEWLELDAPELIEAVAAASDSPVTDADRPSAVGADDTAYVIYTSGSTGTPKGVEVTAGGLRNFGVEAAEKSGITPDSRVLGFASPSFDAFVLEYLLAFTVGASVVYRHRDAVAGAPLADFMREHRVTHTFLTPTVLASLDPADLPDLHTVYAGGEAVPDTLRDRWAPLVRFQNLYGPTETTIGVAIGPPMRVEEPVLVGPPIGGVDLLVLDSRLRPVPVGVAGELYVSGPALARGYLARRGLTAERFVANPFGAPGDRIYRTGDIVRWARDRDWSLSVDYVGRSDDQIKLRGLRIELGEIESALGDHPAVASAVVVGVDSDGGLAASGQSVVAALAAYVVLRDAVDIATLREHLADRLPLFMVPAGIVVLDALPLTPVGKLDRRALPAPTIEVDSDHVDAETPVEQQLATIIAGLLGLERVSVSDSFFALGGDSIMSIQVASAARAAGIDVSPRDIFEHKTVRAIARAVGARGERVPALEEPAGGGIGPMAVPPVVSWILDQTDVVTDFADFSQSMVLTAPAGLTVEIAQELLGQVVSVHPMLSAAVEPGQADGEWLMRTGVAPLHPGAVTALASPALVGDPGFSDTVVAAFEDASRRLDPTTGQLVAAVLVTDPDAAARLVVVIHHLGVDAVSWRVIIEDLLTAWAQHQGGQAYSLRPEVTSARAFTAALDAQRAGRSDELRYWLERSPERVTDLGAEVDRTRDRMSTTETVVHTVGSSVTEALLTSVPTAFRGNVNDALVAALARAVRSWQQARGIADDRPVTILLEGHGRYEEALLRGTDPRTVDLSRTVGWFTTIAPMAVDVRGDAVHTVKLAKEERVGQLDNGIGYGLLRYGDTELSRRPLPSIGFNYLGNVTGTGAGGENASDVGETGMPFLPDPAAPRLPGTVTGAMVVPNLLSINAGTAIGDSGREFVAGFTFPRGAIDTEAVDDLARRWDAELATIVDEVARVGDPGLSPSDVLGARVTQDDLDHLARRYPGADVWPLSPLQRGLQFQAELAAAGREAGAVDVYTAQAVLTLKGEVDATRLAEAVREVFARHRVLRSSFVRVPSGEVVAVVPETLEIPWRTVDADNGDDAIDVVAQVERATPFDLESGPLMRFVLVRSGTRSTLVVTSHHILIDGWSSPLIMADLFALYATGQTYTGTVAAESGARGDYFDYLRYIAASDTEAGLAAWRSVLSAVDEPTLVGSAREATSDQLPRDHSVLLPAEITSAVDDLTRARGVTVSTVMQFAWAVLLSRITGRRTVVFGETVSGRPADLDGVETMVGLFINTLPAVADVDPGARAADVLDALQASKVAVLDHQHLGLPELTALVGRGQLFDTLAVHESYPVDAQSLKRGADAGGIGIEDLDATDSTHYPLNLVTGVVGDQIELKLKYLPAAFDERQVEVYSDALIRILTTLVADPATEVGAISLLDDAEYRSELTPPVTRTRNTDVSLAELFARAARTHADRPAVTDTTSTLDYREIDERSAAVAAALSARGVSTGDLVAVATSRGVDLVSSILGVLRSGAGYLPLDTTNPVDRLRFIVSDAAPSAVIIDDTTADFELWSRLGTTPVVPVAQLIAEGAAATSEPVAVHPDSRAYVIYTSGSTGRPKGVEVTHRDVVTLMDTAADDFDIDETDVWTMFHSYAFDFSVWELWGPLLTGGRLVLVDRDLARAPEEFLDLLARERVTVLSQTPSAFYQLAETRRRRDTPLSLRYIVFGGEALSFEQVRRWFDDHPDETTTLVNMYGITETTVHVSFRPLDPHSVAADDASFIGRPLSSLAIHVLDDRLRPVPEGVVGEMYVTGGQLAQGYLKRAGLSSTRFVASPYGEPGTRMYRTGDLARRVGDDIEYLGRGDAQVQLRGYRIEFGEIEAALLAVPGVSAAAARVVDIPGRGEQLIGYLVRDAQDAVDATEVRRIAGRAVPSYMVPDQIIDVDTLPLTANGKLDRDALPVPDSATVVEEIVAPTGPQETAVAQVFAEVLGVDVIGVTTSFFDLGGNSLSATRLASRVADALGTEVSVRDVFEAPSVRDLVDAVSGRGSTLPPVVAVSPRPERIPLSFAQRRIWFINRFQPDSVAYNIPAVLRLTGPLDTHALRAAIVDAVERHEVLRTTFPDDAGEPYQLIHPTGEVDTRLDWALVDSADELELAAGTGFDVTAQWPLRARLWRIDDTEAILAIILHHIGADGESLAPLVSDVVTAYQARSRGSEPEFGPLPVQFADYAIWQHDVLGDPDDPESILGRQLGYWTAQLGGLPEVLELPADRPRPAVASNHGAHHSLQIPADVAAAVDALRAERGMTSFMVVHAALAVVLARLSATEDIAVATPIAGRGQSALDPLVGMFVNTLVLRSEVRPGMSFDELLAAVRVTDLDAFAHADVPFEALVERINPVRSEAFSPLAQVMLSFDPAMSAGAVVDAVTELGIAPVERDSVAAQMDMTVTVTATPDAAWDVSLIYATDLFDEPTIAEFGARFVEVLRRLVTSPAAPVGDINLLDDAAHAQIESAESGAETAVPAVTLPDALVARVAENPDALALSFGGRSVRYGEFGARVWTLARTLLASGVQPGDAVAVCLPRSIEMMVAIHAVVAAGGHYVPVDPAAPRDRAAHMVETAGVRHVLVAAGPVPESIAGLSESVSVVVVDATVEVDLATAPVTDDERLAPLQPADAAYTLFTSGSTGRPKGVTVSHAAIVNRLEWMRDWYSIKDSDVFVQKTPVTFDVSVWELFLPFAVGATLVVAEPERHGDPRYLAELITAERVSVIHFVPSMLSVFLDVLGDRVGELSSLRLTFTSGEALTAPVAQALVAALPGNEVHNLYGPTEAAVDVTAHQVRAGEASVPIGVPVPNTAVRVLDSRLHRVPVGVPGELYLSGVQLARGYASRPDLTADRFVADPYAAPGGRMYRTGDLVRWNARRQLEYLGRTDFQVKLRGQRLELGEVETVLASVPGVVHAAATVAESPRSGQHLVAYFAPDTVSTDAVKAAVVRELPEYMRPTVWMPLPDIALNSSGKIDRKSLPQPHFGSSETVAPTTPVEESVAAVFADVLGVDRVGVTDSFFDLGGNSLSAMRLAARVGDVLGTEITVRDLFDAPNVRDLIASGSRHAHGRAPIVAVSPRPERIPLSFAQQRMWFINQFDPSLPTYNIPAVVRMSGRLDVEALRAAIADVVVRHEVLRTTFPQDAEGPHQVIADADQVPAHLDFAHVHTQGDFEAEVSRGFDVAAQWPVRACLWQIDADTHVLGLVTHHIASDGESLQPLVADMVTAYVARSAGETPTFVPLEVQFADFAIWQHEQLGSADDPESVLGRQLAHWTDRLAGLPDVLELPADRPRPAIATARGGRIGFEIPADIAEAVAGAARAHGVTPFMV